MERKRIHPPDGTVGNDSLEWNMALAIMMDVFDDPFCPLPLTEWTYRVSTTAIAEEVVKMKRMINQSLMVESVMTMGIMSEE